MQLRLQAIAALTTALILGSGSVSAASAQSASRNIFLIDVQGTGIMPLTDGATTTWGGGVGFIGTAGKLVMAGSTNLFSQNDEVTANNHFAVGYGFGKFASGGGRAGNALTVGIWIPQGAEEIYPTVGITGWTGAKVSIVTAVDYVLPKNGGDGGLLARIGLGFHTR